MKYHAGGNIEINGGIYCGWFVVLLQSPPLGPRWDDNLDWLDHQVRLWNVTVFYLGNRYCC